MKSAKKEPWRIAAAVFSLAFITFLWAKKDIFIIYQTMPKEQVLPLVVTTVAVSLLKVAVIAVGVLLVKWFIGKLKKK